MTISSIKAMVMSNGNQIINCTNAPHTCLGVKQNDPDQGQIPRGLIFENGQGKSISCCQDGSDHDHLAGGCVIVGKTPGSTSNIEQVCYQNAHRSSTLNYRTVECCWSMHCSNIPYHQRLRDLVKQVGIKGPILWTDIAKCEEHGSINLHSLRTCATKFLLAEINATPPEWPIFAVTKDAFNALTYLFPQRAVIGICHPSPGHASYFPKLFDPPGVLKSNVAKQIKAAINDSHPIWVNPKLEVSDSLVVDSQVG